MKKYLLFLVIPFMVGCTDETNELIVFENSIGVKSGMLGTYKRKQDTDISFCYENSKYHMKYIRIGEDGVGVAEGTFIPSKVPNTSDYYIFSFPTMKLYSFDTVNKTKSEDTLKNAIFYFKYENKKLLLWENMLSDKEDKMSTKKVKDLIIKSYTKTFIRDGEKLSKVSSDCSFNDINFKIDKMKKKFSTYKLKK